MRNKIKVLNQQGQALITLLFFIIISVTVTSTAVVLILINSLSGTRYQQGELAYQVAQSGAENAVLRLLRNPMYTGEVLLVGQGSAAIQVSGSGTVGNPYVIVSTGTIGNFMRRIQITATYTNSLLTTTDIKEIY